MMVNSARARGNAGAFRPFARSAGWFLIMRDEYVRAALKVNKNIIVLVHGGPVSSPEDAQYMLTRTRNCHGFYGASSMERLPTEVALTEQTRKFKAITFTAKG